MVHKKEPAVFVWVRLFDRKFYGKKFASSGGSADVSNNGAIDASLIECSSDSPAENPNPTATTAIPSSAGGSAPSFRDDYSIRLSTIVTRRQIGFNGINITSEHVIAYLGYLRETRLVRKSIACLVIDASDKNCGRLMPRHRNSVVKFRETHKKSIKISDGQHLFSAITNT